MIRYDIDPAELRTLIEQEDKRWFSKAATRTAGFIARGGFDETSSIWSKAKPAFMALQMNKCVFCERLFTTADESRIEMDLEHFRPKKGVTVWTAPAGQHVYPEETGEAAATGYYWLAYETTNYAASCKICNSEHKGTYFPIAGPRCQAPGDPEALKGERPYLVYPLGTEDDDPEELITFTGTIARPVTSRGWRRHRADLIIDFFGLNARDQLHVQRAEMIERFGGALVKVEEGRSEPADHTYVAHIYDPQLPHAGCLRAFRRLWDDDQGAARRLYDACREMLASRLLDPTSRGLGVGL